MTGDQQLKVAILIYVRQVSLHAKGIDEEKLPALLEEAALYALEAAAVFARACRVKQDWW